MLGQSPSLLTVSVQTLPHLDNYHALIERVVNTYSIPAVLGSEPLKNFSGILRPVDKLGSSADRPVDQMLPSGKTQARSQPCVTRMP